MLTVSTMVTFQKWSSQKNSREPLQCLEFHQPIFICLLHLPASALHNAQVRILHILILYKGFVYWTSLNYFKNESKVNKRPPSLSHCQVHLRILLHVYIQNTNNFQHRFKSFPQIIITVIQEVLDGSQRSAGIGYS